MIRKAVEGDINAIVRLHMYFLATLQSVDPGRYVANDKLQHEFERKIKKYITDSRICVVVWEDGGGVAGYGIGRTKKYPLIVREKEYGELHEIAVGKESQRRGIGTAIANALIEFFRKRGIHSIEFIVDSKNTGSIETWEKIGFKEELKIMKKVV